MDNQASRPADPNRAKDMTRNELLQRLQTIRDLGSLAQRLPAQVKEPCRSPLGRHHSTYTEAILGGFENGEAKSRDTLFASS